MATQFTFLAGGDRIGVRIVEFNVRSKANESDAVWLDSMVDVQAGKSLESFNAWFTAHDLATLREQLKEALTSLSGTVFFQNTGGGLALSITLDVGGRTFISGVAEPKLSRRRFLHFHIATDHFALIRTLSELEHALRSFPTNRTINNGEVGK
jgi:hypothetical protein